ncbi:Uncharacterised protein [Burkholderia pseudomallei]|nr:Uncharacterised protein [Burkholderia pseudomallei]
MSVDFPAPLFAWIVMCGQKPSSAFRCPPSAHTSGMVAAFCLNVVW